MTALETLRGKLVGIRDELTDMRGKWEAEKRSPTPDELTACDKLLAEHKATEDHLSREDAIADLDRRRDQERSLRGSAAAAMSKPLETAAAEPVTRGEHRSGIGPKAPWSNMGEFARAVHRGCAPGAAYDPRLRPEAAAATTYSSEGSGADGGFLVPSEMSTRVESHSHGSEDLLARCEPTPVAGSSMEFPVDETTPWGTSGVQAYWTGEAAAYTESKIAVQMRALSLFKLTVLVPVSDEMIEDTVALDSYITRKAGEAIAWKVNDAIVNGGGAGVPLGILKAACLASQAKEASQTAVTINAANICKMFGRMVPDSILNAIWLVGPDSFNQLPQMVIGDQPVWIPPGRGLQDAPGGTLMGRPLFISMTCQTLGTKGDIYFAAFNRYKAIVKRGGVQSAMSMHLYFDYGLQAFRFTFRMNGNPWLKAAIAAAYGSGTLSPFVSLDTRA